MQLRGSCSAELRRHAMRYWVEPRAAAMLRADERWQSVTVAVAQYWDDDASDAVHLRLCVSRSLDPGWPVAEDRDEAVERLDKVDMLRRALQGLPPEMVTRLIFEMTGALDESRPSALGAVDPATPVGEDRDEAAEEADAGGLLTQAGMCEEATRVVSGDARGWEDQLHDNLDLIWAFAAYCKPGGDQRMSTAEAYAPYAVIRRAEDGVVSEIVGKQLQPWWEDRFYLASYAQHPTEVLRPWRQRDAVSVATLRRAMDAPQALSELTDQSRALVRELRRRLRGESRAMTVWKALERRLNGLRHG